jgi:GTP pyrophosphokinase
LGDYRLLGEGLWDRFNAGRNQLLWYYRALVETYRNLDTPSSLVTELDRTVTELERLARDKEVS